MNTDKKQHPCSTCVCHNWNIPEGIILKKGYYYCGNQDNQFVIQDDPEKVTCWRHQVDNRFKYSKSK